MTHLPRPERPRLRALRRPDGSVQIGVGPGAARLIGVTEAECRWITSLDPDRPLTEAVTAATVDGIDPVRATEVLDRLVGLGLLHPVRGSALHRIAVVGSGALPALLVDVLRQSERVVVSRVRAGAERDAATDLAVVVSAAPTDPGTVLPWLGSSVPVLPLWCLRDQASIGPLLHPARGPCPHCLELTRTAVDPGWPWLRAQLTRPHVAGPEPADGLPGLRVLAAGLATTLALDHVGGRLSAPEWSFEVATPGPTLERHRWPAHPGCRCAPGGTRLRAVATPTDDGGPDDHSGWGDTMAG